ncbi:IS1182 family transposase [Synechococcus sp. CS-205]|uniref:IS1182 family transposase n=1 Tax=Synechococcus sp. CS-205 TaxID=2847984 RepID=UPI00223AF76E|nr:IS1182 family transposase [Synechococcus sp. CS-205]MCT0249542.1 IS1182 family transposase [Synechococcus sp. CS-205]
MSQPKIFRPWLPEQAWLLPPSPIDWLPKDHLVFFLLDLIDQLDLDPILQLYRQKDARGEKAYDSRMMVVLLLYAYCVGMPSSRKIERACYEDLPFRVLSGNQQPDHTQISEFRRRHLELLEDLFVQVLRLCQKSGLVQMGHVALDGTKVEANASIHKAMSHERMEKSEQQLRQEMRALLRKAEIIDAQEDGRYGKGKRGSELPEELQRRESRLEKIRQAKAELEAESAAAQARRRQKQADAAATEAEQGDDDSKEKLSSRAHQKQQRADTARALALQKLQETGIDPETVGLGEADPQAMPTRGLPSNAQGKPSPKAQRNFTDPDSHVMKCGNGYIQGYNAQAAVDSKHQVIVAIGVSNQAPDVEHLVPMLERIEASTGTMPATFIADAGYWSEANAKACSDRGIDAYISTARQKHGQLPPPSRGPVPKDLDAKGRMARKLRSKNGRKVYARRKAIVEPVFGQTKENRGLRRFLLRGLEKVNGEWSLMGTGHNLLKLFRFSWTVT